MYSVVFERLATDQPELRELVEDLDRLVHERRPGDQLDVGALATHLGAGKREVQLILEAIADSEPPLIERERLIRCARCRTPNLWADYEAAVNSEGDDGDCVECGESLLQANGEVLRYRVTARTTAGAVPTAATAPTAPAVSAEGLADAFLANPFEHAPLLDFYSKEAGPVAAQPLAAMRVVVILHFLRDLIPFVLGLTRLGADFGRVHFFFKQYPYPQRDAVGNWLREHGADVAPLRDLEALLARLERDGGEEQILVIEDGGYVVPAVHQRHPGLAARVVGGVEQTTRGARNDEAVVGELRFPVLLVARSELKSLFEPPYIADAFIRNFQSLIPDLMLAGSRATVFGFGVIGALIADGLRGRGVNVTVFETNATRRMAAQQKAFALADSTQAAAQNKHLLVGAAGEETLSADVIAAASHDAYLASASSDQYEIDLPYLEQRTQTKTEESWGTRYTLAPGDRRLNVVANGYPLNFWGADSMPGQASDLIMTLILLAGVAVASGRYAPGVDTAAVNTIATDHRLAEEFQRVHP